MTRIWILLTIRRIHRRNRNSLNRQEVAFLQPRQKKPSCDLGSIRPLLPEIHNRSQRTCWDWAACDFSTHHPSSPSALLDRNVLHDTQDLQLRGMFSGWDTLRVSRERRRDYGTLGLILSVVETSLFLWTYEEELRKIHRGYEKGQFFIQRKKDGLLQQALNNHSVWFWKGDQLPRGGKSQTRTKITQNSTPKQSQYWKNSGRNAAGKTYPRFEVPNLLG